MALAGYASRNRPFEKVLSDLWAKAIVLEDAEQHRAVLISLDLVGIDSTLSGEICQWVQQRHQLERSQVAIATSHTHSGPVVGKNLAPMHFYQLSADGQKAVAAYAEFLKESVLRSVDAAFEDLQPVQWKWGSGTATFASNRRNNEESKVPNLRLQQQLQGPVDHTVPVLAAFDAQNELHAVVFGYACHATVLSLYEVSGDYPGFAQIELEKNHPGAIAMFWAGCGADQNPVPRKTTELAKHYGSRLADAVDEVLLTIELREIQGGLQHAYQLVDLPLSELPNLEELDRQMRSENKYEAMRAKLLVEQINAGQPLRPSYAYPVQSWSLGKDVEFIFLGGEVVVDYAVRLKSQLRGIQTWVASYSNDVMAYIPSERVLREGGYEGATAMRYYGLATTWAPGIEDRIVDEVIRQVKRFASSARESRF